MKQARHYHNNWESILIKRRRNRMFKRLQTKQTIALGLVKKGLANIYCFYE